MGKKLTPLKAIRAKCLGCCLGQRSEVQRCPAHRCALHPNRQGKKPKGATETQTPLRAIKACCLDCSGGSRAAVRNCDRDSCPLHPYRNGTMPAACKSRQMACADIDTVAFPGDTTGNVMLSGRLWADGEYRVSIRAPLSPTVAPPAPTEIGMPLDILVRLEQCGCTRLTVELSDGRLIATPFDVFCREAVVHQCGDRSIGVLPLSRWLPADEMNDRMIMEEE